MANQTYQLVVTYNAFGQFCQNVFHYRIDDDSFANRLLAAKGLIDGFIAAGRPTTLMDMFPNEVEMKSLKARRVTNGGGPEYVDVSEDGRNGTAGEDPQNSGAGPVIIWYTDGGPKRIGKTFISGISHFDLSGGEISTGFLTLLRTRANTFRAAFNTVGGTTPVATFCIPRTSDMNTRSLVVDCNVSKNVGVQRRRQLPV